MRPPVVLTIAGTDPLVGAGVFADVLTISELGAQPLAIVTALVDQDSLGVRSWVSAPSQNLVDATSSALIDGQPDAVKLGMLGTAEVLSSVAAALAAHAHADTWVVIDPVLASGGTGAPMGGLALAAGFADSARFLGAEGIRVVLTPNTAELGALTESSAPATLAEMCRDAERLAESARCWVLAKGGHLSDAVGTDVLVGPSGTTEFAPLSWPTEGDIHGTGCALSSALAVALARGLDLPNAVESARAVLASKANASVQVGRGRPQLGRFVRSRS